MGLPIFKAIIVGADDRRHVFHFRGKEKARETAESLQAEVARGGAVIVFEHVDALNRVCRTSWDTEVAPIKYITVV